MKLKQIALSLAALGAVMTAHADAQEITVYSARIEELLKPTLERYTQETGVKIKLLTDKANVLAQRLETEGANSPADLLITVDVGGLWKAAESGMLKPMESATLNTNIPANFRDTGNRWWGMSERARTIFYAADRVKPEQLSTYEDLADPKWKGKLCLRTGKQQYTQSLVAMLLAKHGVPKTEEIVKGWVANLATDVFTNDTKMLEAVAAGQCDVTIVNTYYYGRVLAKNPDFSKTVKLFWANQGEGQGGAHINISGAGVVKHAKNPEGAIKLLEWLSSAKEQTAYVRGTYEAPINRQGEADDIVKAWGKPIPSPINAAEIGSHQPEAIRLLDRVGYR